MRFYLGADAPWLTDPAFAGVPLFVSHRRLRRRRTPYPPAITRYAVDSGAFTELSRPPHRWTTTPEEYVSALRRYRDELGPFDFAAAQDSMVEPWLLDAIGEHTGHRPTVDEHLEATVTNYLRLRELAPDLPIVPTIQGWRLADYLRCVDLYTAAGVDLTALPLVAVGSVCRRQGTGEIDHILTALAGLGLRLHAFGVKTAALATSAHVLTSADSMAWSYGGRRRPLGDCSHRGRSCSACPTFALRWRDVVLEAAQTGAPQLALAL